MFGWRRRSEGFEWKEYVRTTVLVRRADRQRRADDARVAMIANVKDKRDRGVEASKAQVNTVVKAASNALKAAGRGLWELAAAGLVRLSEMIRRGAASARAALPRIALPGFTSPLFTSPWFKSGSRLRVETRRLAVAWPSNYLSSNLWANIKARNPIRAQHLVYAGSAAGLIALGSALVPDSERTGLASAVPTVAAPANSRALAASVIQAGSALSGRASAVNGDMIRMSGQLIRLAGIEAPEPKQPCLKANGRRWSCGSSAASALDRMVRGKSVTCTASGTDDAGRTLATCIVSDQDLAAELVRAGHVFADEGLFRSYGAQEDEAKAVKAGLWQGESVRPNAWRERVWEEAKRTAPEGCPIKGIVRASDRIYAMPWSSDYRAAKVRTIKGERWFCSEDDARAAGFKLSSKS